MARHRWRDGRLETAPVVQSTDIVSGSGIHLGNVVRGTRFLTETDLLPNKARVLRRTHGVPLVGSAIQKDLDLLKYTSRSTTYIPYLRQSRCRERLPCSTTRRDTARVALSAVCLCVPRNAGHVTERLRRGRILAKNAVAGANYCCVRVGRTTPRHCLANKRRGETIGNGSEGQNQQSILLQGLR